MIFRTACWRRWVYTLYSPVYDWLARRTFASLRQRAIDRLALRPGERVLIVGAGTGLDLEFLPAGVQITAIDLTQAMLNRLSARAQRLGLDVDAQVMDAQSLRFADGSFDAVILHLILAVVPDPIACAQEAGRVLRPGGRAVIMDKFLPDDRPAPLHLLLLSPLASCFGTEVNRRLRPIVEASGLRIMTDEPASSGGLFRIALLGKA